MSCPRTRAEPASGRSSVASIRIVVVLPAPLGPSTPYTVPLGTARSTPSTARTSPKALTRPSASIARAGSDGIWPLLVAERPEIARNVDCVLAQRLERHDVQRALVRRCQHDERRGAVL